MAFLWIWLTGLLLILAVLTCLWLISIRLRNVSIVDIFWGGGFVLLGLWYHVKTPAAGGWKTVVLGLVVLWGLRLTFYLAWRNRGRGEDPRYREFRKKYGETRYWWISYFQTFLLQGVLMWFISAPLLAAQVGGFSARPGVFDFIGVALWTIGMVFETGGDLQLLRFKSRPGNRGKVLQSGFWRYTRHPNYFGDACVWWGFGFMALAGGKAWPLLGSLTMTVLLLRVSGVTLLERSLERSKPEYREYMERTSAFFPWFPKKTIRRSSNP